jgi:protein-tyrosine kinase
MDRISKAIELAKSKGATLGNSEPRFRRPIQLDRRTEAQKEVQLATAELDERHLEAHRIIAHRSAHPTVAAFDVLRTSLLQELDTNDWQTLAISSPTAKCGKTVLAINLALSIARVPDRRVILIDLDLRRPRVAPYLGLNKSDGLFEVLSGQAALNSCLTHISIASSQLSVLANQNPISNPAEIIGSKEMKNLLTQIKADARKPILIVDTSPMLACDDVLALLPRLDCIVLAVAERQSTAVDVTSCERLLQSANYLGLVLTKSSEQTDNYYY